MDPLSKAARKWLELLDAKRAAKPVVIALLRDFRDYYAPLSAVAEELACALARAGRDPSPALRLIVSVANHRPPEQGDLSEVEALCRGIALEASPQSVHDSNAASEPKQEAGKSTKKRGGGRPRLSPEKAAKQQLAAEAVAEWRAWRKEKPSPKPDLEEWLVEHAPEKFVELGLDPQEVQKLANKHSSNQRKRKQPAPRRRPR
jgi:hypothetical protein